MITAEAAHEALESLDDYAGMECSVTPMGPYNVLRQFIEEAGKDAARYRWLRENPSWETEAFLSNLSPEEFDTAIDSAMGEGGDDVSEWIDIEDRQPKLGVIVWVEGVIRYGRKVRVMPAKRVEKWVADRYPDFDTEWIGLRPDDDFVEVVNLKVLRWMPMLMPSQCQ